MNNIRNIYERNRLCVISLALLVLCSEVFCGIISYHTYYKVYADNAFFINTVLRLLCLAGGIYLTYMYWDKLKKKYVPYLAAGFVAVTLLCSNSGFIDIFDFSIYAYPASSICSVLLLSAYYTHYCKDSLKHTLLYTLMSVIFIFRAAGTIEAHFVFASQLLLYMTYRKSIVQTAIKAVNIVFSAVSAFLLVYLFASNTYDYITFEFEEGHMMVLMKDVLHTMKAFGSTEKVFEMGAGTSCFNLTRIGGYFGYVAFVAVLVVLTVFVVSVCVKAYKYRALPAVAAVAAVLSVRYAASLFINFGVLFGEIDVSIPILSDGPTGYLSAGIMLGLVMASDKVERVSYEG